MLRRSVFVTPLNNCNFIENKYFIRKFGGKWKSDHSFFSSWKFWWIVSNFSKFKLFNSVLYILWNSWFGVRRSVLLFFLSFSKYFPSFPIFSCSSCLASLKMNHLKQMCQKRMSAIATSHSLNLWLCIVKIQVPVCHQFLAVLLTPSVIWLFS